MANPPDLQYCKIIGNFKAFVADGDDSDDLPDFVPMSGSGSIWPNVTTVRNTSPGSKSSYFNSPISVTVDLDGDLSQGGRKYVMVLAGGPELNPSGFNYSFTLNLAAQGESLFRQYGPFAFDVVPGGTVDLTDIIPVAVSGGTPVIQGPAGPTGATGSTGPGNSLSIGTVSTLSPGSSASASITGDSPAQTLSLGIPSGPATNLTILDTTTGTNNWTYNELRGTGSPEGAVSASIGTYYTDLNNTNGAWRWIKTTSSGSTGWKVISGDTGWRDITTDVPPSASWQAGAKSYFRLVNTTATIRITGTMGATASWQWNGAGTNLVWLKALGWSAAGIPTTYRSGIYRSASPTTIGTLGDWYGSLGGSPQFAANTYMEGQIVWIVPDSYIWPTSLPGTPVTI